MSDFRVSDQASTQLDDIYDFTELRFGHFQAEAYWAGLHRTFALLADFQRMGRAADEFAPGLRRFRYQSHHLVYSLDAGQILIRAVFHFRQDIRPDLIE